MRGRTGGPSWKNARKIKTSAFGWFVYTLAFGGGGKGEQFRFKDGHFSSHTHELKNSLEAFLTKATSAGCDVVLGPHIDIKGKFGI